MELNENLKTILNDQIVGGSIVLIKGEKEFKHNYGFSSLINEKRVEDESIFRIASISKVIVGMAVIKLVEDKILDLDEDISNILEYKVRNPKYLNIPITTRMLMLHTSSITDGLDEDNLGYNGINGHHQFVSLEDLLTNQNSKYYTVKTYSDYAPGEKYIYSNFGTGIIACIIEKCSNQLFTEFVEKYFFKPLHIDASFKANNKDFIDSTYPDYSIGNNFRGPAGGLFVSMQDLSKIMVSLMNDGKYKDVQILTKESVDTLLNMNFFANRYYNDKQINIKGYTGGAYGICSVMYFSKSTKTGVCFIANGGNYKPAQTGLNNLQESVISLVVEEL